MLLSDPSQGSWEVSGPVRLGPGEGWLTSPRMQVHLVLSKALSYREQGEEGGQWKEGSVLEGNARILKLFVCPLSERSQLSECL